MLIPKFVEEKTRKYLELNGIDYNRNNRLHVSTQQDIKNIISRTEHIGGDYQQLKELEEK